MNFGALDIEHDESDVVEIFLGAIAIDRGRGKGILVRGAALRVHHLGVGEGIVAHKLEDGVVVLPQPDRIEFNIVECVIRRVALEHFQLIAIGLEGMAYAAEFKQSFGDQDRLIAGVRPADHDMARLGGEMHEQLRRLGFPNMIGVPFGAHDDFPRNL